MTSTLLSQNHVMSQNIGCHAILPYHIKIIKPSSIFRQSLDLDSAI